MPFQDFLSSGRVVELDAPNSLFAPIKKKVRRRSAHAPPVLADLHVPGGRETIEDILWAVLTSKEFLFVH
jgi:hypothetical protein